MEVGKHEDELVADDYIAQAASERRSKRRKRVASLEGQNSSSSK